jgi:hypothetical protein
MRDILAVRWWYPPMRGLIAEIDGVSVRVDDAVALEPSPSAVPRVLGLLIVVVAFVGLLQSVAGLLAEVDFEAVMVLGAGAGRLRSYAFWVHLTGLAVGGLHLAAGVAAAKTHGRAPALASVYAGVATVWSVVVVVVYFQTLAPLLRPFGKTDLFGGHEVGMLIGVTLGLGWAALVALVMNLKSSRRACSG